jgi:hypothetical protein
VSRGILTAASGSTPLKDRRREQFEKICQASFSDKFIDGPKANCTDDANNQISIKTESMATPWAGAANARVPSRIDRTIGFGFCTCKFRLPGSTNMRSS